MRFGSRVWRGAAAVVCAVIGLASPAGSRAQPPVFRADTQLVSLFATVTDARRRLVCDLTRDDFEVFDDRRPQPLAFFLNESQPITVVVMLDTSASVTGMLDLLREAAEQFVIRLLPGDRGRVGAFNDRVQFGSPFTSDRDRLGADIRNLGYGNGTKLFDALMAGLDELRQVEGRRVILVFTDGFDTRSRARAATVVDRARADEVMVYAIGLQSSFSDGTRLVQTRPDPGLQQIAAETGGGYFELNDVRDLAPTFTAVSRELHAQYLLGFTPARLDGKVHALSVRVKQRGMTARARRSYVAR
jgi:Ca-activated chloride channel family protein